jgi:putative RecB family exonuclease
MPTYSNSRLSAYENCPMQYRLKYIDQVEVPPRESVEAYLGKRVHEALEYLYMRIADGYKPTQAELVAHFRDAWDREWNDTIHVVRPGETVAGYRLIAERCLTNYYRKHDPFEHGRTIGAEMLVTYPLDPERDLHLQGYIDRLVDLGGGHYEIHDYKTSRRLPSQSDVDRDRQLALYQMAVSQRVGDVRSIKLVWHYLAHDRMLVSVRTPDQLRSLRDEIVRLIDTIESATAAGNLPARITPLCAWCDFKPVCPAHATVQPGATAPASASQPVSGPAQSGGR